MLTMRRSLPLVQKNTLPVELNSPEFPAGVDVLEHGGDQGAL